MREREGSPAVVSVMLLTASSCLRSSVITCQIDGSPDSRAFYCLTNEVCDISATFSGHRCTLLHLHICKANNKDWEKAFLTCQCVRPVRETPGKGRDGGTAQLYCNLSSIGTDGSLFWTLSVLALSNHTSHIQSAAFSNFGCPHPQTNCCRALLVSLRHLFKLGHDHKGGDDVEHFMRWFK